MSQLTAKPKIVFFGTSDFAVPFLRALVENNLGPVLVITQPDEPAGRKKELQSTPIKIAAQQLCLDVTSPEHKDEIYDQLQKVRPDVCVLVAYGKIIPKNVLALPPFGFINVHPSLLPKYRGPSPVQTAILNGEEKTGVTIMLLDDQVDHGPIFTQKEVTILSDENNHFLHQKLADVGTGLLLQVLSDYLIGKIKPAEQNHQQATFTRIIQREDGLVDWHKTAQQISCQFRAFYPWPGCFTHWGDKRLKIANLSVIEGVFSPNLKPGEIFLGPNQTMAVACSKGAVVLDKIQLEGKNEVIARDFLRGHKNIIGQTLM